MPPLWQWPILAAESTVANQIYNLRRDKVKSYIAKNLDALMQELSTYSSISQSKHLAHASMLAKVATSKQENLFHILQKDKEIINKTGQSKGVAAQVEMLTLIFMVHST